MRLAEGSNRPSRYGEGIESRSAMRSRSVGVHDAARATEADAGDVVEVRQSSRYAGSSASRIAANVASPSPRTVMSTCGFSTKNSSQSPAYFGVLGPPWIVMLVGFASLTSAESLRLRS